MQVLQNVEQDQLVWEEISSPANKVTQGDLFYFEEEENSHRYGIVVTADCDLVNCKHSRLVSLVPLLSLDDVLVNCLYIDHLEKIGDDIARLLHKELSAEVPVGDPAFPATIASILKEGRQISDDLKTCAKIYLHQADQISGEDFKSLLKRLGKGIPKTFEKFEQQIKSRGDLIVLSRPPYAEHDAKLVWLRHVWQVSLGKLSLRNSSYVQKENHGRHMARLASPYRYRLTQQFAQVFSDIGIPKVNQEWISKALQEKTA